MSHHLRERKITEIALNPAETAIPTRISLIGSKPFDRSLASIIIKMQLVFPTKCK